MSLKVPVCVVGFCTHVVLTFVNGSLLAAVTGEEESSCKAQRGIDTRQGKKLGVSENQPERRSITLPPKFH